MKVRFNRWYNGVLAALLSILGYGCSDDPVVEYGTPHADYTVKGQVTDEAGNPIRGIKTAVKSIFVDGNGKVYVNPIDSVQTDASGQYLMKYTDGGYYDSNQPKIVFEDVDGSANGGEFLSDTLDADYNNAVKTKNGDGWYLGAYEITQNVKLKKK